jgi:hypothetical protein
MSRIITSLLVVLCLSSCSSCKPDDPEPKPSAIQKGIPIIAGTTLIRVTAPYFDTIIYRNPSVIWEPTASKNVIAAIFDADNIEASSDEILNFEDVIWAWHSGLGTGREGSVFYNDGRKVENGRITDQPPVLLNNLEHYVLGIWAWNIDGTKIVYSSDAVFFKVKQ